MKTIVKDIAFEIREMKTDRSSVRKFGWIATAILGLITGFLWYKTSPNVWYWAIGCGVAMAFTILWPAAIVPLYKTLTVFSIVIGYFVSRLILSLLYFLLFTPVGLTMRLFRRDPLKRKPDTKAGTYWIRKDYTFSKEQCERLF